MLNMVLAVCFFFWPAGMVVMRTMRRELVTIMIPQKATQVSFYPSLYCMCVCEVCKNDLNSCSYVE